MVNLAVFQASARDLRQGPEGGRITKNVPQKDHPLGGGVVSRITIIVPCFNEEATLETFYRTVTAVTAGLPGEEWEYLFVDDGSRDRTLSILRELAGRDKAVRYLSFSRNFGKEAAMYAGLEHARGEYVAVMDADLQDPPELLGQMLETIRAQDCDCVAARRVDRKGEPPIRSFLARGFYRLINRLSRTEIVDGARDYRLMTRAMVDSILRLGERNRFSKGIFSWVGYRTVWLEMENRPRTAGESKWSVFKLFAYAMDGIMAFSTAPLTAVSFLGVLMCLVAFLSIIVVVVRQLVWGGSAFGWPSMVCILLLVSGLQLLCLGILGQYLAKTYVEVKARPIYLVRETGGGDKDGEQEKEDGR